MFERFKRSGLVGATVLLATLLGLVMLIGLTKKPGAAGPAGASDRPPVLTDTCPQGMIPHTVSHHTGGLVCLHGYLPLKRERTDDLVREGRQR